jgi:hypothetical protein
MAYVVNKTDGNIAATVNDGTINTATSLKLIGIGYPNYAETVAEDFVALLENFASANPPINPISGQLWYNKSDAKLKVYDGEIFRNVNNVAVSSTEPILSIPGDSWYDTTKRQLFYRRGGAWQIVAPLYSEAQGRSEMVVETFTDITDVEHTALVFYCAGVRVLIFSSDPEYQTSPYVDGFSYVNPGINIPDYAQTATGIYWAGNGNSFSSGGSSVGGSNGQLQYNSTGFLAGATGLITDGLNLEIGGDLTVNGDLTADLVESTSGGFKFPDNSIQVTAALVNPSTVTGTGTLGQISYFNTAGSQIAGSAGLTTNGTDLIISGNVSGSRIISSTSGITFPDGSIQTTAAFNNAGAVNGAGAAGQLSYFNTASTVTGATGISTNGVALTVNGLLSVGSFGIKFSDNTVITTAPIDQIGDIASKVSGSGNNKELAYFISNKTVQGANNIFVNNNELELKNGAQLVCYNAGAIRLRNTSELQLFDNAKITFADGTIQATSGIGAVSKALNGYQKIPGGIIIQWGNGITATGNGDTVTFPIPFPSAVTSVIVTEANAIGWLPGPTAQPTVYGVSQATRTSFKVYGSRIRPGDQPTTGGLSYFWQAIGY